MTSARNRLPLSSGNRWFIFLLTAFIAAACSPKLQPVAIQPVKKEAAKPAVKSEPVKEAKALGPKVSVISLLLPFGLDHLQPGSAYTSVSLKEADIALDYYRGFKLALDSLTGQGYSYKLQVFDTRGQKAQSRSLAFNPAIKNSDLIVGPVFPDDLKIFSSTLSNAKQPLVSPLSPAAPASIKNNNLITVIPPLEYHAWGAARYISDKIKPKKIFILRSGFSEENDYIVPFRKAMDSLGKKNVQIISLTVIHGQLNSLLPQLSANSQNVFIIPATNQHFLTVTLRALDSLSTSFPVTVFGHPNWMNISFLKADLLQRLNTFVTSSDRVDYKDPASIIFMRDYRDAYQNEPSIYAFKGFDEGMYMGRLLGSDNLQSLTEKDFEGLHNDFHFVKKQGNGWVNTHINLFKYSNFELKKVE